MIDGYIINDKLIIKNKVKDEIDFFCFKYVDVKDMFCFSYPSSLS